MENYTVTSTKEFTWDMAHMLAGHQGLCKNLHGHTYKMEVTVAKQDNGLQQDGPSEGMVIDFKELKDLVQEIIVAPLDHATMINTNSTSNFEMHVLELLKAYGKKVVCVPYRPTAENMAINFMISLRAALAKRELNINIVKLRVYETPTSYAEITC